MKTMKVISCNCKNEYQDKKLGHGKRYANWAPKHPTGNGGYRCTVCGREVEK